VRDVLELKLECGGGVDTTLSNDKRLVERGPTN
jgi:hypothetical protein